jgi:Glycosyltransferase family 87
MDSAAIAIQSANAEGERPHWLTLERLRVYPWIIVPILCLCAVGWVLLSKDLIDPAGKPLGYDFITFWSASWLALGGEAVAAYDPVRIALAHQVAVPATDSVFLWHYPPTFFLLILPLAKLPYFVALAVFVSGTFVLYAAVVRRIAPTPLTLGVLIASPAVFVNAFHGQNGFLTAAVLGAALLGLDRRPVWSGLAIGFMAYKPHFAALLPIALACRRAWTAFAVAAVAASAFVAVSLAVMGWDVALAFVRNTALVRVVLENAYLPWPKMPTLFATAGLLGASVPVAYAIHAVGAASAIGAAIFVWLRAEAIALRGSALVLATILTTPYVFDYDLALLALPIGWLAMEGVRTGFARWEREILVAAWLTPLVAVAIAEKLGVQLAPVVLFALLAMVVRRTRAATAQARRAAS